MFGKIKTIDKDKRVELDSLETWMVYWYRYSVGFSGRSYPNSKRVSQAFIDENQAKEFAKSLEVANRLIGNSSDMLDVTVEKQKNGL
jgi:hypothetical protein